MPSYEFRCRACGTTFEATRPMARSSDPAACPAGHDDTVKLMTIGAVVAAGSASTTQPGGGAGGAGGGCCGGGCCS